jgi:putative NADH-flavin reductase
MFMDQKSTIAVLGGGGRTGKFLVSELISRGYHVKLLLRKTENYTPDSLLGIVEGDATDPAAIQELLKDCHAVVSTVSQRKDEPLVASRATENIINTMQSYSIGRYIAVGGINIETPFDEKGAQTRAATAWMKENFPRIHEDRQKAYAMLSSCELDWTLVRVPMIEFKEGRENLQVDLKDCAGSKITADAIARFLADQLQDDRYLRKAPFIFNG